MHIEAFYTYCMSLPGTKEDFPFDVNTLVFKVMGKMFALTDVEEFNSITLKCDPLRALELRTTYEEIKPGYHMNKKHWNTIGMNGNLPDDFIRELIKHSYDLVVAKLPAKSRQNLQVSW